MIRLAIDVFWLSLFVIGVYGPDIANFLLKGTKRDV